MCLYHLGAPVARLYKKIRMDHDEYATHPPPFSFSLVLSSRLISAAESHKTKNGAGRRSGNHKKTAVMMMTVRKIMRDYYCAMMTLLQAVQIMGTWGRHVCTADRQAGRQDTIKLSILLAAEQKYFESPKRKMRIFASYKQQMANATAVPPPV